MLGNRTVAVLHAGQMGTIIGQQALKAGADVVWSVAGRSVATCRRAESAGLRRVADIDEVVAQSEIILAVCPPHAAEEVAASVADRGFAGTYVEGNPISPRRIRTIARILAANGAAVVDGCVIGPAEPGPSGMRLYLSGEPESTADVTRAFELSDLRVLPLEGGIGAASALKLSYALSQKIGRALAAVSYALAEQHAVRGALRVEAEALTGNPLDDPDYLRVVAPRGWRWAPEMAEISDALADAGLPDRLPLAAVDVFARWNDFKDHDNPDLPSILRSLSARPAESAGTDSAGTDQRAVREVR